MSKPNVIVVTGPTASGKTALAVQLAKAFGGEVISADSMQIYKQMNIGTAKPTREEMQGVPHHLMDFLEPDESFSVARFAGEANRIADGILSRGKLPILCGGTGLYISAFTDNLRFEGGGGDSVLRDELSRRAEEDTAPLLAELTALDPDTAAKLHPSDKTRIIRALELAICGLTLSEQNRLSKQPSKYNVCMLALTCADRSLLYDRINRRVDRMFEEGLVAEAEKLQGRYSKTAAQAIGYKELFEYFDKKQTLPQTIERIKQGTRNYAKRQLTWLRPNSAVNWVYTDRAAQFQENIFEIVIKILEMRGMV